MRFLKRIFEWMFGSRKPSPTWWQVILWWEIRRIPYNLIVGGWGIVCLIVYLVAIGNSGHLKPGEDAIEPMAILAAPFLINACYTLGWLVELPLRRLLPGWRERIGPTLMKLGVAASLLGVTLPAAIWVLFPG
ncbi:MAG TPA: hypothetical protein VJY35_05850 [Candidatus Eisenbacteria bacterium]|nr:hypothetical protein [Candidatus Eisenbacteria bacterium]